MILVYGVVNHKKLTWSNVSRTLQDPKKFMNDLFAFDHEKASNIAMDRLYLLKPFLEKESFDSAIMQSKL